MKITIKIILLTMAFATAIPFSMLVSAESGRSIRVNSTLGGLDIRQSVSQGANYALIIGINEYAHHPRLKTAVNDAKALRQLLQEKYFFDSEHIIFLTDRDATKPRIVNELRDLVAKKVKKGDNVFIYYAGHGWYDTILKTGYWVTTEATRDPTSFLENNAIYQSIAALDEKGVRHVLLVSDSCFSGSFTKDYRSIETDIDDRYFTEKYKKPSRIVLTSGGVEPVADAGKSGHSVFAYYFLKALEENSYPYISAKQVGAIVEKMVTRNSTQTPVSRYIHGVGDEQGEFFFINARSFESEYGLEHIEPAESEPDDLPNEGGADFDDIMNSSEARKNTRKKWDAWQAEREKEYNLASEMEKDENLTNAEKAEAWSRFLAAVSQDNPYSTDDDEMRTTAALSKTFWEEKDSGDTTDSIEPGIDENKQQSGLNNFSNNKRYVLKPTQCRGDYGLSLSVIDGEIYQNRIKLVILHYNKTGVNEYYCLLNPKFETYVTDEVGNKYPLIYIEGIAAFDTPNQVEGYTKIVRDIPLRYELTFDALGRIPKVLNFTSTYYTPDMVGILHFTKTSSCSSIQVVESN